MPNKREKYDEEFKKKVKSQNCCMSPDRDNVIP